MRPFQHLIAIAGLPGSGKTYLADHLETRHGYRHMNTDRMRKQLGLQGDYSPQAKQRVYTALEEWVWEQARTGENVLLDATFHADGPQSPRQRFQERWQPLLPIFWVVCTAPEEVIRERVSKDRPDSEADFAVYQKLRDEWAPLAWHTLTLDTGTDSLAHNLNRIEDFTRDPANASNTTQLGLQRPRVDQLQASGSFPEGTAETLAPELVETHISWILLMPETVYKMKKPHKLNFLDFSTRAERHYYLQQELTLNRRLAPEVYRSVEPLFYLPGGELHLGEIADANRARQAFPVDYALRMQRLDRSKELDKWIPRLKEESPENWEDALPAERWETLARRLAEFHHQQPAEQYPFAPGEHVERFADLLSVAEQAAPLLQTLKQPDLLKRLTDRWTVFLQEQAPTFQARIDRGCVRELHGDLHTGNIFFTQPPVVFDCLEFNRSMRVVDVLDELAFLQADLYAWGAKELPDKLWATYCRALKDLGATHLLPQNAAEENLHSYFIAYRLNVRAKVSLLKAGNADDDAARQKAEREALRFLAVMPHYV